MSRIDIAEGHRIQRGRTGDIGQWRAWLVRNGGDLLDEVERLHRMMDEIVAVEKQSYARLTHISKLEADLAHAKKENTHMGQVLRAAQLALENSDAERMEALEGERRAEAKIASLVKEKAEAKAFYEASRNLWQAEIERWKQDHDNVVAAKSEEEETRIRLCPECGCDLYHV